jgi:hypothetical protein
MKSQVYPANIRNLQRDPALRNQLLDIASKCRDTARTIAPFRTGAYKASLYARIARGQVTFGSDDRKAWWIEYGDVKIKAHHVLKRAAKAHGLKWVEVPGG